VVDGTPVVTGGAVDGTVVEALVEDGDPVVGTEPGFIDVPHPAISRKRTTSGKYHLFGMWRVCQPPGPRGCTRTPVGHRGCARTPGRWGCSFQNRPKSTIPIPHPI
jgi:hypothetical protein